MSARASLWISALLISSAAFAETPLITSEAHVDDQRHAVALVGTSRVGAGVLLPSEDTMRADGIEAAYAPSNSYLEVRAARVYRLTAPERLWNLSTQLGLDGIVTTRGPVVAGGGPNLGISGGVGRSFQAVLSLQAGVEGFAGAPNESHIRYPLRGALGLVVRLEKFRVSLWGRAGADLQSGMSATARYDATLAVGWVL